MMSTPDFLSKFKKHESLLHGFAYNLTKDTERAKDLYQETAYRAIKNMEKFSTGTNFKAWLMTIMKNIFINDYRRKSKANTLFDHTDNQYFINSGGEMVRNAAGSNILMQELTEMIDELEDGLRIPFLMHYQGYKYKEIAEKFELPVGTIKSRIFFARKALKAKINEFYGSRDTLND